MFGIKRSRVLLIGEASTCTELKDILLKKNCIICQATVQQTSLFSFLVDQNIQFVFADSSWEKMKSGTESYRGICYRSGVQLWIYPTKAYDIYKQSYKSYVLPSEKKSAILFKRLFDVLFSFFTVLFLLSWFLPILSLLIKLESKGPVFFKQKRTGLNNKTFTCYKLRSMVVNSYSDTLQASASDYRITPMGHFLRNTNIDELPQFFNVLQGAMSVVGPRPHMLKHTEEYSLHIDNYMTRHHMKPGVTGLAQSCGMHGETDQLWKMEKRLEFDIEYIKKWSFWLDLKIIFWTVFKRKDLN